MRIKSISAGLLFVGLSISCGDRSGKERASVIEFVNHDADKKIEVLVDGKIFTSFRWPDSVYKPILYPVLTSAGTEITRGFPLNPRQGERNDHIHQVGIWLNYGNVNGIDFWGNGSSGAKDPNGGVIRHIRIERLASKNGEGSIISDESWLGPAGRKILDEKTEYHFIASGSIRIIDRITTLKAGDTAVIFKDTKEGMFGIRVARQLELPSEEGVTLLDSNLNPSPLKDSSNSGVTGNYHSSEGVTGLGVWGTRARWMDLTGIVRGEQISIVICDHPKNIGYATYWHARGYGLFAANPLGRKDFTNGKEIFDFTIPANKSTKFRYRIIISSGNFLSASEIEKYFEEFSKKYK